MPTALLVLAFPVLLLLAPLLLGVVEERMLSTPPADPGAPRA